MILTLRFAVWLALLEITWRPNDGRALLASRAATLATLLVDPDIPIRRVAGLAIDNLRVNENSLLVPSLEAYLSREDAVSTIGGGVAGLLMKAAPDKAEAIDAIVLYIGRKDHTLRSRSEMLQSIQVSRNHNRDIGKALAKWTDDPNGPIVFDTIRTLQGMGSDVISDNQQILSTITVDPTRASNVRDAATKALSGKAIATP